MALLSVAESTDSAPLPLLVIQALSDLKIQSHLQKGPVHSIQKESTLEENWAQLISDRHWKKLAQSVTVPLS